MSMDNAQNEMLLYDLKKRLGIITYLAVMGDSDDESVSTVDEPGRPGWVRVRLHNDDVPYRTVKCGLLGGYSPYPGSPVVVGYDEKGDLAIEKADFDALVEAQINPLVFNTGDNRIAGFTQTDGFLPLWVGAVSEEIGTASTAVAINSFRYVDGANEAHWFQGQKVDLVASIPGANLHRYVALFLNTDDTIVTTQSTPIATITPLQETDKQECFDNLDDNAIPIWLFKLQNSQASITNADKVEDLRPWLQFPDRKNNFTAIVAPTVNDDIDLGYEVGSHWYDVTADNWYVCIDSSDGAAIWQKPVITTPATAAQNTIQPTADVVPLTLKLHAGGTANGFEVIDNANNKHVVLSAPGATDPNSYFNKQVGDSDTIAAGDTEANLFRVDAGADEVRQGDWDTNYAATDKNGDSWWVGGGGLIFGHMYIPGVDIIVDITDANPTEVFDDGTTSAGDGWSVGELNLVTFPTGGTEHYLTIPKAGKYEVTWDMSFQMAAPGANVEVHGGIMIDDTATRNKGEAHRTIANNTDTGNMGATAIIDCPVGTEEISLWILNADNNNDVTVEHGNMTIKLIGGT